MAVGKICATLLPVSTLTDAQRFCMHCLRTNTDCIGTFPSDNQCELSEFVPSRDDSGDLIEIEWAAEASLLDYWNE
jgi:hypothetical protein